MKKILTMFAVFLLVCAGNFVFSQVVGSPHDLSSGSTGTTSNVDRVCVFCHTPHQAAAANGQDPLWNHELSAVASYGVYDSATLNATLTDLGGATVGTAAISNLCLSCHDGTVAVSSLYNDPNEVAGPISASGGGVNGSGFMTGPANVGTDLSDDHPVNFVYDAALVALDPELNTPAVAGEWVDGANTVPLFVGTVQCASCHDPHDNTNAPFLVMDNTGSALCITCHIK
jgi:predicted CXXCH cytochrome family protein